MHGIDILMLTFGCIGIVLAIVWFAKWSDLDAIRDSYNE